MQINSSVIIHNKKILKSEFSHSEKLPRYLFHFTNLDSAKKILKDGFIKTTRDGRGLTENGVFMVDFQNLVKNWTKVFVTDDYHQLNLLTCLLGQISKGCKKIACFRIPSNDLSSRTVIRSQNELKKLIDLGFDNAPYFSRGSMYKLFQRNGHSIEYIHFGDIKVSPKNFVGTAEISQDMNALFETGCMENLDLRKIEDDSLVTLKELFKSQAESKALTIL